MIEFAGRYENKKHRFFIRIENDNEFEFLRPYFLVTSSDHPRKGRIMRMDCLFSGSVWEGSHSHGWGYSCSADVYDTLFEIIRKSYGKDLSADAMEEIRSINTHNDRITLSDSFLEELRALNDSAFEKRWS